MKKNLILLFLLLAACTAVHAQWPGSEYHELETYDHGFSQNIYIACELASDFLIKVLK